MWFHLLSHKFARLLLPYAVLAIAVSSFMLPSPGRSVLLVAQGLFYAAALADVWVPRSSKLKRHLSAARTFVVLMAAAICAPFASLWRGGTVWGPAPVRMVLPATVLGEREAHWRHATTSVR
jgi:hypothetical protein